MLLKNKILQNFSSLTVVNLVNLLLPIITIPYLIKTLGATNYGLLAYHQYLGQFILVVLDFGFPLYAVSEVARRAQEPIALGGFVMDAYIVKLFVLLLVLIVVALVSVASKFFEWKSLSVWLLIAFSGVAIFNSFAPSWLFQGLDILQKTILPTLIARSIALVSTFLLIHSPEDIRWAPFPYLLGSVTLFCILSWRASRHVRLSRIPERLGLQKIFTESLQVFWSRLTIMGYVTVSPLLINATAGTEGVAVYNICEKVISVARMPFDMFAAATYAHFSRNYRSVLVRRFLVPLFGGGVLLAGTLSLVAPLVVMLVHVPGFQNLHHYLALYGLALIPISMHGFIGTCVLLPNGKRIELAKSIAIGLLTYVLCLSLFWPWIENKIGLAIAAMVTVEFGIFFSRLFFSIKYRLV